MTEEKIKDTAEKQEDSKLHEEASEAVEEAASEAVNDVEATAEEVEANAAKQESERYMRLMAEFQNYKKRVDREKSDIRQYANEKIIVEQLQILDNFERALASDATSDPEAYAKGMKLIFDQLKDSLEKAGLSELTAEGEDFDPNKHNAVMTDSSGVMESGKVSKVMQKGYSLNGKVIRPAMVMVAE